MTTHKLKCWPEPFLAIKRGEKLFEVRRDDRGYEVADLLELSEWVPCERCGPDVPVCIFCHGKGGTYALDGIPLLLLVTFLIRGPRPDYGLADGFVIMSMKPLDRSAKCSRCKNPIQLIKPICPDCGLCAHRSAPGWTSCCRIEGCGKK